MTAFWIKNLPQSRLPYTHYKLFINGCMCRFTTVLQLSIWELKAGGLAFTTSPGYTVNSTVLESNISKESGSYTSLIPGRGKRRQPDLCKASLFYTLRERGENDNCLNLYYTILNMLKQLGAGTENNTFSKP